MLQRASVIQIFDLMYTHCREHFTMLMDNDMYNAGLWAFHFKEWYTNGSASQLMDFTDRYTFLKRSVRMYAPSKRAAYELFSNEVRWLGLFFKELYGGLNEAFWKTKNVNELAESFMNWFEEKRKELRRRMKEEMQKLAETAEVAKLTSRPITHGGVANLLKILTRTMEKQGADIRSIAKVQYAICTQAGIYIPEEFIEDVAVVLMCEQDYEKSKEVEE